MKIVIDIPDRIYKIVQNRTLNITDDEILENALKNGTPLPKGHSFIAICDSDFEAEINKYFLGKRKCDILNR